LDATQTVAANRPIISVNTIGGARVVVFDSVPVSSGTPPAVSKFMNIPVGLSIVPRTACIIAAGQNYYGGMTSVWAQLGVPTDFQANCSSSVLNGAPNYPACLSINGGLGAGALATGSAFNVPSRADPAVYVWNCNTNNASYYANNHIQSGVTNTGRGAVAVTTGQIGTSTGGTTTGNLMFGAMLFYPTAPTTVQIDNIRGSLCRLFNIAPQTMDAVVTFGDSVAAGQAGALGRNTVNQSIPSISIPMREYNLATSGSSVGPASTNAAALAKVTPNLQRIYNSSLRNFVVVLSSGANDIVSGRTPGQILGDIASFFQQAAAFGPNVKRVVCTIIPNGAFLPVPSVSDTERQTVNTMIRAQWPSFADALCDHAANPIMGDGVDLTDTTLFSDTIHCTALGYSYLAIQRAGVINTLLT
jgi:lysophospholipase L1-like esterase